MLMALCQNNFAGSPEIVYAPRVAMHHPGGCPQLRSRPCLPVLSAFFTEENQQEEYYSASSRAS